MRAPRGAYFSAKRCIEGPASGQLRWRTAFMQCSPVVVRFDQDPSLSFGMTNCLVSFRAEREIFLDVLIQFGVSMNRYLNRYLNPCFGSSGDPISRPVGLSRFANP